METFNEMGLPGVLIQSLQHMQFNNPTPIQSAAIPLALKGQDILGSAQTGTGKSLAFIIPLIVRLLSNPRSSALVMAPTRELATQLMAQLHAILGKKIKIKSALLIGGESMPKQLAQLRNRPRLIVGTPGRIRDHLQRRSLSLNDTDFLVLDETDRMLDMGFTEQIEAIMTHLMPKRQTLLFSATLPKNIVRVAEKYLNNPAQVAVNTTSSPAKNIKQDTLKLSEADKYPSLLSQLDERQGSVIVFVKTKYGADKMAKKLSKEGHSANAIHGDLRQNRRNRVIGAFRNKKYRILVATDVAARGLDIPHIEHVINYDLPQCAEDYIHRIGRTARAGAEGEALNFVTPSDKNKWNAIDRLLNPKANRSKAMPSKPNNKKKRFEGKRKRYGKAAGYKGKGKLISFPKRKNSKNSKRRTSAKAAG